MTDHEAVTRIVRILALWCVDGLITADEALFDIRTTILKVD